MSVHGGPSETERKANDAVSLSFSRGEWESVKENKYGAGRLLFLQSQCFSDLLGHTDKIPLFLNLLGSGLYQKKDPERRPPAISFLIQNLPLKTLLEADQK